MASVASHLIEGVTAHAKSDSLEDARENLSGDKIMETLVRTAVGNAGFYINVIVK